MDQPAAVAAERPRARSGAGCSIRATAGADPMPTVVSVLPQPATMCGQL